MEPPNEPPPDPGGPTSAGQRPDVEALVDQLRARVERRRAGGLYPPGLESDLDAHFRRIAAHRPAPFDWSALRRRLDELDRATGLSPDRIAYESALPGGAALHRAVARAVSRQTGGVLDQVQRYADAVRAVLDELVSAVEHPTSHVHTDLLGQIDAVAEKVVAAERQPTEPEAALAALRRRVERLEAEAAGRRTRPWYATPAFEDRFRGTRRELLDRYLDLAERFVGSHPVVDLGCGRGEFLELLDKFGVEALGVDHDPDLLEVARDLGLPVEQGDVVEWLSGAADASLGGIACIRVVEHLTRQRGAELVRLAGEKLRPGGLMVIETFNPGSPEALARAISTGLAPAAPLHPAYAEFLLAEAGFADIDLEWRPHPGAGEPADPGDAGPDPGADPSDRLPGDAQDYAVIAVR